MAGIVEPDPSETSWDTTPSRAPAKRPQTSGPAGRCGSGISWNGQKTGLKPKPPADGTNRRVRGADGADGLRPSAKRPRGEPCYNRLPGAPDGHCLQPQPARRRAGHRFARGSGGGPGGPTGHHRSVDPQREGQRELGTVQPRAEPGRWHPSHHRDGDAERQAPGRAHHPRGHHGSGPGDHVTCGRRHLERNDCPRARNRG